MVVISAPATSASTSWQLRSARVLSTRTVQAPHSPAPQPYLVPVRLSRSRKTQSSGVEGSSATLTVAPLTLSSTAGNWISRLLQHFLVVLHVAEADSLPPLLLVIELEQRWRHEHRRPVEIARHGAAIGRDEPLELACLIRLHPAHHLEARRLERHRQPVLRFQPLGQHVELQRTDHADDRRRPVFRQEDRKSTRLNSSH